MWLFLTDGFVSAVEDKNDTSKLVVRSRDRHSLELLLDQIELAGAAEGRDGRAVEHLDDADIREGLGTDYRYRVSMTKETFAVVVQHYILNHLTYKNFKDAVVETRGAIFHDILLEIWFVHRDLDDVDGKLAPVLVGKGKKVRRGVWF